MYSVYESMLLKPFSVSPKNLTLIVLMHISLFSMNLMTVQTPDVLALYFIDKY